jgi:hypothetical protein
MVGWYAYLKEGMMRKATTPIVVALILVLALAVGVNAQAVATNFTWVVTKLLTVTDTATFTSGVNVAGTMVSAGGLNVTSGGLNVTSGGLNVTGGTSSTTLSVSSDASFGADIAIAPRTAISVSDGGIITPTGTLQMLESGGNVTATLAAGQSGQHLTLINTANTTILIQDTTGQIFSGDVSLAQWDTASFVFYGASWIQTGESNN